MIKVKNKFKIKFCFFLTLILLICSCSKPIVINNKLDLSPNKLQNSEIHSVVQEWNNIFQLSQKNKDLTILWEFFSDEFKLEHFYNVFDFFKAKWSSVYEPLFTNIMTSEIREIKYEHSRQAATLTLINERANAGKPIYLTICRNEKSRWRLESFSGMSPSLEILKQTLEKSELSGQDAITIQTNLDALVKNGDYISAYELASIILEKSAAAYSFQNKADKNLISNILKISNFYFYLYSRSKNKTYLFDISRLLEKVIHQGYYDNKIFYTLGYSQILNNNFLSANTYFDRAVQIIAPSLENSENIKNLLTHIIDAHLINNEWNTALLKIKMWETNFAGIRPLTDFAADYKKNWSSLLKYNCADITLKYKIIEYYKTLQFDSAAAFVQDFRIKFPASYYSDYIDFIGCLAKYYQYSNTKSYSAEYISSFRNECEYAVKKVSKYQSLIYSIYIESYLKEGNNFSDYNTARKLILKFNQTQDIDKLESNQMIYFYLASAKTYQFLKLWEQALVEYKKIQSFLKTKKTASTEEKDILKYVETMLENQVNYGYLALPYIGVHIEQKSFSGDLIVKRIIDNPALLPGDIIISIAGIQTPTLLEYYTLMNSFKIGMSVKIKILRDNSILEFTIPIKDYI